VELNLALATRFCDRGRGLDVAPLEACACGTTVPRANNALKKPSNAGVFQFAMGTLPRDCVVTDVSDGGLRAFAENVEVPAEFLMILSNGQRRQCRLVWRIGCEFGAEFIG
jgi:hypothetical protein